MTIKDAQAIVGSRLGKTAKMPARSWGISVQHCQTGSKYREKDGTSCHECYAAQVRSRYGAPSVQAAHARRLAALDHPQWVDAMVTLIGRQSPEAFRWFDSGDLQSVAHLDAIAQIARRLPTTLFWLPTQERGIVARWRKQYGAVPANLTIRPSMVLLGVYTGAYRGDPELGTSMVLAPGQPVPPGVTECRAPHQGNRCLDCRQCWDRSIPIIAYRQH